MSNEVRQIEAVDRLIKSMNRRPRRRPVKIRVKKLERMHHETANDDSMHIHSDAGGAESNAGAVVLGVYGTEDWILSSYLRDRYLAGKSTAQLDGTWLTEASFELLALAEELGESYTFFGANGVLITTPDDVIVKVRYARSKIEVEFYGELDLARRLYAHFDTSYKKAENLIEWIYNSRGDDISVPLNYRPAIRSAYPWIDPSYTELSEYIDEYIDSTASVLILIGEPGTGKTTFIKNLIHRSKANAKVAYDPKVMMEDGFFAGFIGDETRFLIMEDADEFLQSRTEGNTMMHKFLNVSDGLISAADKKMVFSTNLPNISDIDPALMRPGRCFDVLQFRALTRVEAKQVLIDVGSDRELPDGDKITLAECFASLPSGKGFVRRKIGFTS